MCLSKVVTLPGVFDGHFKKNTCVFIRATPRNRGLNGGEDYELLFTVSKKHKKKINDSEHLTIIGSCVKKKDDNCMITSLGQKININSSGWDSFNKKD